MNEIINNIFDTLTSPLFWLAVVAVIVGIRLGLAWLIRWFARLASHNTTAQLKAKTALLSNEAITESYAPAKRFTVERDPDSNWKPLKLAWLSPYSRAVKASFKRNRVPSSQVFLARKQIHEASKYITISSLPPELENLGSPEEHFILTFKLDGRPRADFKKMEGRIVSQLGLHSLKERTDRKDAYAISFIANLTEPVDSLVEQKPGLEFFEEHPANSPYSLPLALKENGKAWSLPLHHTLIYGMTGSGKGSPIHGAVRQLTPFIEKGTARLYGIDPKASELRPFVESSLFESVVFETEEAQELIAFIHKTMKRRAKEKKVDVEKADLARGHTATQKSPVIVLFIDELLSLLIALKALGKPGAGTMTLLTEVLAQGRSLGIFVIGATQAIDQELLGRMRINFANTIILRQDSDYFNDLLLGTNAKENGFDSTAIPASNKSNGYKYAGIGFVKEEGTHPARVRFAYSSDEAISELIKAHPKTALNSIFSEIISRNVNGESEEETLEPPAEETFKLPDLGEEGE